MFTDGASGWLRDENGNDFTFIYSREVRAAADLGANEIVVFCVVTKQKPRLRENRRR